MNQMKPYLEKFKLIRNPEDLFRNNLIEVSKAFLACMNILIDIVLTDTQLEIKQVIESLRTAISENKDAKELLTSLGLLQPDSSSAAHPAGL
jgi:hypothetical protein